MSLFTRLYGNRPRHLLAVIAVLAFAAYGWVRIGQHGQARDVVIWFVGAILAHDLIIFPLYRLVYEIAHRGGRVEDHRGTRLPVLRHMVVPAVLSGLLLLAWVPLILTPGKSAATYTRITGVSSDPFLGRWLLITAGLFVTSALLYAVGARRYRGENRPPGHGTPEP